MVVPSVDVAEALIDAVEIKVVGTATACIIANNFKGVCRFANCLRASSIRHELANPIDGIPAKMIDAVGGEPVKGPHFDPRVKPELWHNLRIGSLIRIKVIVAVDAEGSAAETYPVSEIEVRMCADDAERVGEYQRLTSRVGADVTTIVRRRARVLDRRIADKPRAAEAQVVVARTAVESHHRSAYGTKPIPVRDNDISVGEAKCPEARQQ